MTNEEMTNLEAAVKAFNDAIVKALEANVPHVVLRAVLDYKHPLRKDNRQLSLKLDEPS